MQKIKRADNKEKTRGANLCEPCADKAKSDINGLKIWYCKRCSKRGLANPSVIPVYCHPCSKIVDACEQCGVEFA